MVGFPFDYGDELNSDGASKNRKAFLKKYGRVILVNGVLFLVSNKAFAVDSVPKVPTTAGSNNVAPAPTPAAAPVFTSLLPVTTYRTN